MLACALLMALAGCGDDDGDGKKTVSFDPKTDLFGAEPDPDGGGTGTSERTFECTKRAEDGSCLQNKCTQGPGGATFDCASFAAACVNAGEHWSGTAEGGKCTKVL